MNSQSKQQGGTRQGAGAPSKSPVAGETKSVNIHVKVYPSQRNYIDMMYGSVQKFVDSLPVPVE